MNMESLLGGTAVAALFLLLSPLRSPGLDAQVAHQSAEAADSAVLASLRTNGADLSKPTEHLFYLYFPTEATARATSTDIDGSQSGQNVAFEEAELDGPNDKRPQWMIRLTVHMVPDLARVKAIGKWLTAVATQHRGEYDGWEAAVTK